ncbi:hypothetical protein BD770DRAFT_416139 [Pilaira anomala]|nr:hypothetical protein BD770DRAFT_416139 [Pilaira anomala]
MSAQLLPFEVLSQIFPLVPHSTVYQCTLVCKSWNVPATTVFYSTLKLGGRHDFPLNKLAKNLECDHLEFFKHGHLVKRLVLRGKFEEFSGPVAFCSLLSCLPYLKLIDITDCSIASEILEILKSYGKHVDLKYLQDIYAINPKRVFQQPFEMTIMYFKACFSFRETITRLRLNDIENIYYTENNIYQRTCLDLLSQFKQLTHLAIDEHPIPIRVEKNAQFQLPLILQSCPNLIYLRIHRPLPHFDYSRDDTIQQLLPKTNKAIPSRSDGVYLKTIDFFFTVLGASQMEYITSSLCTSNLNSFVIKTRHLDAFFEFVQNEEIFINFVQHIIQAKYLYFSIKCRTLEELGPQQITYENSKVHQIFWKMLHAVEPVRIIDQIFMEIDFLGDQSNENHNIHPLEYPTISCSMEIKKKTLYFHQEITPREFFNKSEQYGKTSELINSFVKNKTVKLEFLMDSSYFLNILLFVANHLPHIQNLYLKDPGKTPIQSIECFLNYQTSSEDNNNNNNNNNKRISSARIKNTFIRGTTFIILSEAIPKLETLWIYNCSLSDNMNSSSNCSDQTLLDLTALKDLKHLIMDQDDIIKYYKEVIYHFENSNEENGVTHNLYYMSLRSQGKHAFYPDQRMLNPSFRKSFKGYYVRILLSSKIERISL